ncbi:DUF5618 family protein [Dyadobacter luticola]|uniref:DUF5618 domain-containing protein n=1 Tax=Dyadobacter luticola TaxID=1979387 RepID=A0A5R9L378_9BACT|nr:DUF5618 family protein [Dyadobacter luticola]TLV03032.1 hypothetical protein FEN17_05320 [Dyadobacter luticola]
MGKTKSVQEAKRYVDNAKTLLREKALKEDEYYQDEKYVKLAGHAAYTGVLVALDSMLGDKKKGRKEVSWYKEQLSALDKKVLKQFVSAYDLLHLSMSYDGNPETAVAQLGLKRAEEIINWVEQRTAVS